MSRAAEPLAKSGSFKTESGFKSVEDMIQVGEKHTYSHGVTWGIISDELVALKMLGRYAGPDKAEPLTIRVVGGFHENNQLLVSRDEPEAEPALGVTASDAA
jgi:hypothetical protein